ncbi:GbsR/MarR family transcriptional regulator [Agromyces mediolanus]|uniref:HTH marR-type domain-containing protein n=1 Tax=Agromyces mediolanus TaxID=41986 RepID=A0A918CKZ4_AGRME|nr:MarR family transcriptional regulator [Agromyces mediolanus]GGR28544.1 hypothetical protein GCM10010196_22930 [Agromyces mediolanus]GLJ72089.1 hypothetical protein GCM10017583_13450 [Agromyces mediolanus]
MTASEDRGRHRAIAAAEEGAAMLTAAGMPRMPSRVLMALVASPAEGSTAAELAERLGVSAAAVSGAVRYLQTARMAQRISSPDSRRDRYRLFDDTWHAVLTSGLPIYSRLAELIDEIADDAHDDAAAARGRDMAGFFRFMAARMPELLEEWEGEREALRRGE